MLAITRCLAALWIGTVLASPACAQNRSSAGNQRKVQPPNARRGPANQRKPGQTARPGQNNKPGQNKKPKGPVSKLPSFEGARRKISTAPIDISTRSAAKAHAAEIDRLVLKQLSRQRMEPNPPTTDAQFIRRVYLDIAGRIPTAAETHAFLESRNLQKRDRAIDRLLGSPAYASHIYNYWADILRLIDFNDNVTYLRPYSDWVKDCLRENKAYDEWVREMLTATGKSWENPAVGYTLRDKGMPLDNLNNTTRVFLGTRIGCAQCHDHPFDRWTQKEFYELAALLGNVVDRVPNRRPAKKIENVPTSIPRELRSKYQSMQVDPKSAPAERQRIQQIKRLFRINTWAVWENPNRRLKYPHDYAYDDAKPNQVVKPDVIFGTMPDLQQHQSGREAFAAWLTSKDNPRFALTIANRLWHRNFGVGVIEPVDDVQDQSEPSNPELMAYLENLIKQLNFDTREFQRVIYLTETYQRQSTMEDIDPEQPYHFPGPVLRRMTAEQVWDSMLTLTVPQLDTIVRPPDAAFAAGIVNLTETTTENQLLNKAKRFVDLQAAGRKQRNARVYRDPKYIGGAGIELARASELPQPLPSDHFLRQFGQGEREIIQDSSTDGTVPQLLTMFNGPVTHMMLDGGSVLYRTVTAQSTPDDTIDTIFLSILNRRPTSSESRLARQEIKARGGAGVGDVIWALLNTREFLFIQ